MLETSRRQGASIFVYLIFCLLIAIFVINFGPSKGSGQGGGCTSSSNIVVGVDGQEASQSSYHIAYANGYNRGNGKQKTYVALETIIRRELLAQEAESRGMRVDSDLIQEQIKQGWFFLGGQRVQIPGIFDENHYWNLKAFKSWYSSMNVSRNSYVGEQARGLMASMMAEILKDSVQVSRDEALQHYLFENNTVQYDVVAFKPDTYRAAMKLTDADIERFVSTHGAEVEARYKTDERTYKAVKPQLQLRQIFIAKLEEAPPPAPAPAAGSGAGSAADGAGSAAGAGSGSAAAAPAKPTEAKVADAKKAEPKKDEKKVGLSIDDAKKKLEDARTAIAAGKQKFADAAKALNTDEAMKNSGGDLGWRTADNAMLGDKAVSDAIKTLKPGEMTPVIATDRGVYLVLAEAKREGDLTFDQVKHEIAKELAKDVWAKEAAKRAALAALDKARGGTGLNLEQMYEKEPSSPGQGIDIEQILNDPNLTQEQKQKLLQMMLQQQQGQKSGALEIESTDIPAKWGDDVVAQADGSAAGSAASPATGTPSVGSAAPAKKDVPAVGSAAPAKKDVPAVGSAAPPATGSAAPAAGSAAPAAGSGAGSATGVMTPPPTGTTPAPADDVTPSTDTLPAFDTVKPPFVARFGPAPRATSMSGLGTSKAAVTALFDELSPGMLAKRVYEADGGYILLQLISRSAPKVEDFDKEADRLVEELRQNRGAMFLEEWLKDRCEKLAKDNKIHPNPALIREFDDAGKPLPVSYRPCMSFH